MKREIASYAFVFALGFFMGTAHASTANVSLLVPPDRSLVEKRSISIVARAKESAIDAVQLSVSGKKDPTLLKPVNGVVCYGDIILSHGENRITIAGLKRGTVVEQETIVVSFPGYAVSRYGAASPGFKKYVFHAAAPESQCRPCHSMEFAEPKEPSSLGKSPCIGCHGKMLADYRFVHGPAASWACTTCHQRKATVEGTSALQGDEKSCSECHAETMDGWKTKKYQHGPTEAGLCIVCHNPHGSNFPYFVRMNTGHLCNSCHEKKILQPHVITGFTWNGHPLKVDAENARLGMTISCASCHNPHAGNNPRFLIGYDGSLTDFCRRCHKF